MKWILVRYQIRPESLEKHTSLIRDVMSEIELEGPKGLQYGVLRDAENTFTHIAAIEEGAKAPTEFNAFKAFQEGFKERSLTDPLVLEGEVVGHFQMFMALRE